MDVTRRARSWSLSEPLGCTAPSCPFCTYSRSPLKEKDEESSIPGQAGPALRTACTPATQKGLHRPVLTSSRALSGLPDFACASLCPQDSSLSLFAPRLPNHWLLQSFGSLNVPFKSFLLHGVLSQSLPSSATALLLHFRCTWLYCICTRLPDYIFNNWKATTTYDLFISNNALPYS